MKYFFLLLVVCIASCTESETTEPTPVDKEYSYQVENIADIPITITNKDITNSKANLVSTVVPSNSKIVVKTKSDIGLNYLSLQTDDTTKIKEYTDSLKMKYYINAFDYTLEYRISGNVEPVTITYINSNGTLDSLKNIPLPYTLRFKIFTLNESSVFIAKNNVSGTLKVELLVKGKPVFTELVSDAFGSILSVYNTKAKTTQTTKKAPKEYKCGVYNGNITITGPEGGCFYLNSNGNKVYVDRSYCKCN
ncbi:MAG: hypothetical protein ACK4R6_12245 [Spirosomataceae bacterium]